MSKLVDVLDSLRLARVHVLHDDFDSHLATTATGTVTSGAESGATVSVSLNTGNWESTLTDSGTASVSDGANGILALVASDGSVGDNDEAYIYSKKEVFKIANNKPMVIEASVQFTEANTDDANIIFGLMNAVGANALVDNGAGPKTTGDFVGFYKVDGGTVWKCQSKVNGGTPNTTTTTVTAGGSSYQKLRAEVKPFSSSQANVAFFIDDNHVGSHTLTYTSSTEVQLMAGVKNGGTNLETLNVDYLHCSQLR